MIFTAVKPRAFALQSWKVTRLIAFETVGMSDFIFTSRSLLAGIKAASFRAHRARGFAPEPAARSSQVDFIIALVASGLGVALLPRILTEGRDLAPLHVALVDETDLRWRAALVWRKGARLSPAARAWLALARERLPG